MSSPDKMSTSEKEKIWSSRPTRRIPSGCYGGCGIQPGFLQTADNRMYEDLRTAVLREERERRISLGLPPDRPTGMAKFKNWIKGKKEPDIWTSDGSGSIEDVKKT